MKYGEFASGTLKGAPFGDVWLGLPLGWAIGAFAWGDGRNAALAAVLPLIVGMATARRQAFAIAFGYFFAAGRTVPAFAAVWFSNEFYGWALTTAFSTIGGVVWAFAGWTASGNPWRKALAAVLGWVVTLLPPVAAVLPGHPVIAWGYITPGWQWIGVVLSALVPAAAIGLLTAHEKARATAFGSVVLLSAGLVAMSLNFKNDENRYINNLVAVSTNWGNITSPYDVIDRVERMGNTAKELGKDGLASVVVFPESVLGNYDQSLFPVLELELLRGAERDGQTIVLGVDMPTDDGGYETTALAFYPDGDVDKVVARQVVPFALWRPWEKGTFRSDWRGTNILKLRDGIKARVIFCYEEYIPILSLINEARDEHQLVVIMSNTWADEGGANARIQNRHSEGIARLFGRHVIKAENRAGKLKPRVPVVN